MNLFSHEFSGFTTPYKPLHFPIFRYYAVIFFVPMTAKLQL